MSREGVPDEGWAWPWKARKRHYFVKGRSLCGKWGYLGRVFEGRDKWPDNCVQCQRKLRKRRKLEAIPEEKEVRDVKGE